MKFHPILFSTDMVKAILDNRKTMTRRIIKEKIIDDYYDYDDWVSSVAPADIPSSRYYEKEFFMMRNKYNIGDVLWVRETWNTLHEFIKKPDYSVMDNSDFVYKANNNRIDKWKPSIYMPKEAARIFLEVVNVRVERVQDISEKDAIAEGIEPTITNTIAGGTFYPGQMYKNYLPYGYTDVYPKDSFRSLWSKINGEQSWNDNPWVWVVEFKQIDKPENF